MTLTCKHCDWRYEWIDVGLVGGTREEKARDFWAMVNHATSHGYDFTGSNWEELDNYIILPAEE